MCSQKKNQQTVQSPDGKLIATFFLKQGVPCYMLHKGSQTVIDTSQLGYRFKHIPAMDQNFELLEATTDSYNEAWTQPWGEEKEIQNHYNQLAIQLKNPTENLHLNMIFRAFNDGIGFRYEIPRQTAYNDVEITCEGTEFNFTADHKSWWIPGDPDSYEYLYHETPLSKIDSANTPVTFQAHDSLYISIHEAALTNYAGMRLSRDKHQKNGFKSDLVPWPDGIKVKAELPMRSPWRTIQVAENPGGLIESNMILNLNEPNKLDDISYVRPMKYVGIWWGMHIGLNTWHKSARHGATTENAKKYMDFASKHHIPGLLVEGWNKGWKSWLSGINVQNYTQPYKDFDMEKVVRYANQKGVSLIGHHETGGNIPMYEKQMEAAFQYLEDHGIHAVKTGYAGEMRPKGMHHHGQFMVNHYRRVVELAHRHRVMVDAHEPIKPTGIRRTYPNMMTREGIRGMEYNAWSKGNPPSHHTILPFTRLLAGPADYTPGIFDVLLQQQHDKRKRLVSEKNLKNRVHTTLAKQLALFVVFYSPLQMASDLVENYQDHPAFQFIEDVPVDWETTRALNGEIGQYVTIARKDRHSDDWYIGSLTNEKSRKLTLSCDFLDHGKNYTAQVYKDGEDADWKNNPTSYAIDTLKSIHKGSEIELQLAAGGGAAIRLSPED
ncbi:MAG: glycoside hydrolase family 97 protein [Bacteroidales bacterium]|nr:glycoside hydrolase family 97 protein [Bacteroidales bacterium]